MSRGGPRPSGGRTRGSPRAHDSAHGWHRGLLMQVTMGGKVRPCGRDICGWLGRVGSALEARHGPRTQNRLYLFKFLDVRA
eukprot:944901-Prymnesium_polylepis.4